MKTYELAYIVSSEITSEVAEAKTKEIESAITSREGSIIKQSIPTAKTFSYPVSKTASGFFGVIEFQLEPEKLPEITDILSKDKTIVRSMVTIKKAAEFKKARRTRTKVAPTEATPEVAVIAEKATPEIIEDEEEKKSEKVKKTKEKEKVELKDIEHELDEILG